MHAVYAPVSRSKYVRERLRMYRLLLRTSNSSFRPGPRIVPPLHMHWLVPVLVLVGMYLYSRVLALLVVHKYIYLVRQL